MKTKNAPARISPTNFRKMLGRVINDAVSSRIRLLTEGLDGDSGLDPIGRNLDAECGYPFRPTIRTFRRMYDREGYATRVVNIWPDECFATRPQLYETEDKRVTKFERAFNNLLKKVDLWHYLHRLDRLSGIGQFGVMLLGLNDGKKLSTPAPGFDLYRKLKSDSPRKKVELAYVQTFAEDDIVVDSVDDREGSPRYGRPLYYTVNTSVPTTGDPWAVKQVRVHWSRIIHAADNCENNDFYGVPRMRSVLNRLLDLRKILGSSGEMFWKGGFPGYIAKTQKDVDGSVVDLETVREQVEAYLSGTQRFMGFDGMDVDSLVPQAIDPSNHVMQQIGAICASGGYPIPVFLGREAGHLAGMENTTAWNKRVASRQEIYVEGKLIRPAIDRLIDVGVLPEPPDREYFVSFKDLNTLSDKDKADVSMKKAQALGMYAANKVEAVCPLYEFLTGYMGDTPAFAQSVVDAVQKNKDSHLTDPLGDMAATRDANLQIKIAKAAPKPPALGRGSGSGQKKKARTQGGGRTGSSSGGRPGRVVSKS